MGILNNHFTFSITAGQDLIDNTRGTGTIYKAINVNSGMIASGGDTAGGLILGPAQSGNHVNFLISGVGKFTANAAISAGDALTITTSGYGKTAVVGEYIVGKALESVTSGSVGTGYFDFTQPVQQHPSDTISVSATGDLSAQAGKVISTTGDIAANANTALGIMQSNTNSGDSAILRTMGVMTGLAGGVLGIGDSVTVTSGWIMVGNSGSLICGRVNEASAAGNSGSSVSVSMNFATPHYATNCFDVQY